jgi:hypothetical protein
MDGLTVPGEPGVGAPGLSVPGVASIGQDGLTAQTDAPPPNTVTYDAIPVAYQTAPITYA